MCQPTPSLLWKKLRARRSLPNPMAVHWVRDSGKNLSLISPLVLVIFILFTWAVGAFQLVSGFLIKEICLQIVAKSVCLQGKGESMASYSTILLTIPSPPQNGFYFTLIVDSFIVGRILDFWIFSLSNLMFHCLLNSLVVNEMPILKLIFTPLSVISSLVVLKILSFVFWVFTLMCFHLAWLEFFGLSESETWCHS